MAAIKSLRKLIVKHKLRFCQADCHRYASYFILKYKPKNNTFFLKKKFRNLNHRRLNNYT